jgi:hypothetical protein
MKATWRFRAVRDDLSGFLVRRIGRIGELFGTDKEALEFLDPLNKRFAANPLVHGPSNPCSFSLRVVHAPEESQR